MWGEDIDGQDCGDEINNWFSTYLGKKVTLLKHHVEFGYRKSKKLVNGELIKTNQPNQLIRYRYDQSLYIIREQILISILTISHSSDGAPLLVMNYRSVDDLNKRIKEEHPDENPAYVTIDRFRPNIFFEADAYEEDEWKFMKIGHLEFEWLIECGRCRLTTLNMDTLEYEKEPLRTLKVKSCFF